MTTSNHTQPASNSPSSPDRDTQIEIYRRMALIEANDAAARKVVRSGKLVMPYYSPRGQEVIPSALSVSLNDDDYISTIYRGTHDMLAKGLPLRLLWAEIAGKVTGTCKGKGGPMHITHPETGIMVTTGIVGSSMPIANGLAWASKLSKNNRVSVAYFGDGASNIGAFHESLNLASVMQLPVIFVCQNNRFAEHTRYEHCTSVERIATRAQSYSMPGITVDGNDPHAMYAVGKEAIDRARSGHGPTLIEALTFRFNGHVFGDTDPYMTKEEKAEAIARDPIPIFRAKLIAEGLASEDQLAEMEAKIKADIEDAIEYALSSDDPSMEELTRDVYADSGAY